MMSKSYLYLVATCFILMVAENAWFMARINHNIIHAIDTDCKAMLAYPDADASFNNLDKSYPWDYDFKNMIVYQTKTECDD